MALFFVAVRPVVLIPIALCLYIRYRRSKNALLPMEWPILGTLPSILSVLNSHSLYDSLTSTFFAKSLKLRVRGPPLTTLSSFFLTCDPENVNHIFTKHFAKYPKGDDFASVFPLLEGTIFTTDGEPWRLQRRKIHQVLASPPLLDAVSRSCRDKVAGGLVPLLSHMAATGRAFDIQDMLGRLVFDTTVTLVFGEDPCCLSTGLISSKPPPVVPVAAAMDALMEVALFRHMVPALCWKAMRWLKVGPERNAAAAEAVLWDFVVEKIQTRMAAGRWQTRADDILSHYMDDDPDFFNDARQPTDFMHRTFINFLVALRDPMASALPWFVYSLAMHPRVVSAVRDELAPIAVNPSRVSSAAANRGGGGADMVFFEPEELEHLVYLRAALFESLRLYPPVPILRKVAAADDVLPSGHTVHAGDTIMVLLYSMARMESVWGDDCGDYRPERWLSDDSKDDVQQPARLRFVPSYKFLSYNTGPRSCMGKNISVTQMMSIAAAVAWNFDVEVVEGHAVQPKLSVVLQMNNGLMVRINKRGQRAHGQG